MDPEGRSRTGISAVDSCVLYLLSYVGVVCEMLLVQHDARKMAVADALHSGTSAWASVLEYNLSVASVGELRRE